MACSKCKNKTQICRLDSIGFFDVNEALKILKNSPRKPRKLSNKDLRYHVSKQHISAADPHLEHVNNKLPGIIGKTEEIVFLLDGNHRALNCFLSGMKPFYVYELSEFESGRVFIEKPPKGHKYVS